MFSELQHSVADFLHEHGIRSTRVLVAVSGGVDSIVLLHTLHGLMPRNNLSLHVAHVNHGLRKLESDDDERFVIGTSSNLGLPCHTTTVDTISEADKSGKGLEDAARTLRYAFLAETAAQNGCTHIAIAHTADDVAETVVMHLARGSGLDGLTAHKPIRPLEHAHVIRPLFHVQRSQVEDEARANSWKWREDASNADRLFQRNQVRHDVMPALRSVFGPDVSKRIGRSAELLEGSRKVVALLVQEVADRVIAIDADTCIIDLEPLPDLPQAVQRELIRHAFKALTGLSPSYADTMRLENLLGAEAGSRATLQHGVNAVQDRRRIVMVHGQPPTPPSEVVIGRDGAYVAGSDQLVVSTADRGQIAIDPDTFVLQMDALAIRGRLRWRPWKPGDRFVPFGMSGSRLVSDLLTDLKVSATDRDRIRVIADDEGLLWVCGKRAAERTRIVASTQRVCTMTLRTESNIDSL